MTTCSRNGYKFEAIDTNGAGISVDDGSAPRTLFIDAWTGVAGEAAGMELGADQIVALRDALDAWIEINIIAPWRR